MTTIPNADEQPDDRFGYSCYALVFSAPDEIVEMCNAIEGESKMTRAKIPAHITVKGTFCGIESLRGVEQIVRSITGSASPIEISFEGAESRWRSDGGGLSVPVSSQMQELHDTLVAAISPISTSAYVDDPYRPHMTYVQEATPEGLERAKELAAQTDFGDGFVAEAVDLMGRAGKAYGGKWKLVERFRLGGEG